MDVLNGSDLIHKVVSLTELPEPWVSQEVDEILRLSGHERESLTLEQLRASMLHYLESIHAGFEMEEDTEQRAQIELQSEENVNGMTESKTSVFFE